DLPGGARAHRPDDGARQGPVRQGSRPPRRQPVKRSLAAMLAVTALAGSSRPALADGSLIDKARYVFNINPNLIATVLQTTSKCEHWDHKPCSAGDWTDHSKKQVLIFSAGFTDTDRDAFFSVFDSIIDSAVSPDAGTVWTVQKKDQLLFVG